MRTESDLSDAIPRAVGGRVLGTVSGRSKEKLD